MQTTKKLLVITTGGTIDALYDPTQGTPAMVPVGTDSAIPQTLEQLGARAACDVYALCQKDSKQVTPAHLQHIAQYIAEHDHEYNAVIITHGTDTMPVHARKLKALLAEYEIAPKTIIFTGAMQPLRDGEGHWRMQGDGMQNLTLALESARSAPTGVYLAIEGALHDAETLDKNVSTNPDNTVRHAEFVVRSPAQSQVIIP